MRAFILFVQFIFKMSAIRFMNNRSTPVLSNNATIALIQKNPIINSLASMYQLSNISPCGMPRRHDLGFVLDANSISTRQ